MSRRSLVERILVGLLGEAFYRLPEGRTKCWLRGAAFRIVPHLPQPALVNRGDVVVQAGCWRIETVEEWSKLVGPEGRVVVVEADGTNADILDIEIGRRELENVTLVQRAVWNEATSVTLEVSEVSKRNKLKEAQTYTPRNPKEHYDAEKEVPGDTIDNILTEVDAEDVDHVHFTISGAEIEAIEGMAETLQRGPVRLFVRAILLHEDQDEPINERVARMLRDEGLKAVLAKREPERDGGGNVYAWQA